MFFKNFKRALLFVGERAKSVQHVQYFEYVEIYHQFHDGFMPNEQYPQTYNSMMNSAFKDGRIVSTGCPDINVASL